MSDIEQIRQLRARFARTMDTKDWQTFRDCFTDDCVFDCTQEDGVDDPWLGGDVIVQNIRRSFETAITVHHPHTAEIEILGPATARGIWAMQDFLRFPGDPTVEITGMGHYHEEYRKGADGRWRVSSFRLTRLRVDVRTVPASGGAA